LKIENELIAVGSLKPPEIALGVWIIFHF